MLRRIAPFGLSRRLTHLCPKHSLRSRQSVRWISSWAAYEVLEGRVLLSGTSADRDFSVMSRNLYVGTDLQPIINAIIGGDPGEIVGAVSFGWQEVLATNFPERAEALADEIVTEAPILVGLQEVALWRTGAALDPGAAETVEFDYLSILLDELSERGLEYTVAAVSTNFDAEVTGLTASGFRDIRLTDRDVILVRSDLPSSAIKVSNPQASNFETNLVVPLDDGGFVEITRGWTSVDAKIRGKEFRFINTHLELDLGPSAPIQYLQTLELLTGPVNTDMAVVLLGDFNAPADDNPLVYQAIVGAGFQDAWAVTNPGDPGATCCHDADLRNETVNFHEGRIDLIFFRGDIEARSAALTGDELSDRTPSGLWPSDHAGVVATLVLSPRAASFEAKPSAIGAATPFRSNAGPRLALQAVEQVAELVTSPQRSLFVADIEPADWQEDQEFMGSDRSDLYGGLLTDVLLELAAG